MSYRSVPLDRVATEELLREPAILKLVAVLNLSSQSILELLEYDLSRHDISMAFAKGVITFEKTSNRTASTDVPGSALERGGDYYFTFLSRKVRLTDLGIYILETIEQNQQSILSKGNPSIQHPDQGMDLFSNQAPEL